MIKSFTRDVPAKTEHPLPSWGTSVKALIERKTAGISCPREGRAGLSLPLST